MKHALVLSGGGAKVSFQLGMIQTLIEQGIKFSACSGISGGALNAAFVAQDKIDDLIKLWLDIDNNGSMITAGNLADLVDGQLTPNFKKIKEVGMNGVNKWDIISALTSTFFKGGKFEQVAAKIFNNLDNSTGILDNTPLALLLQKLIKREDFKMPYYFGLTELTTGKGFELNNKDFTSDKDLANAILASATMPVIWDSVRFIQTKKYSINESADGGLRTVSPIGQVFDTIDKSKESEEWTLWLGNANSKELAPVTIQDTKKLSVRIGRTLDVLLNQVFNDDIDRTVEINEFAEQLGKRKVTINIVEAAPGILGNTLDFRKETINKRIEIGKALTSAFF